MATKADLATRAMQKLGLLMPGESASSEDAALAQQKVQSVHDSLGARGLLRWTIDDIPVYAEEPYIIMAAALLAPEFGVPNGPDFENGEFEIRRVIATPPTNDPVAFEAF